jgi:hypothetical protein
VTGRAAKRSQDAEDDRVVQLPYVPFCSVRDIYTARLTATSARQHLFAFGFSLKCSASIVSASSANVNGSLIVLGCPSSHPSGIAKMQ